MAKTMMMTKTTRTMMMTKTTMMMMTTMTTMTTMTMMTMMMIESATVATTRGPHIASPAACVVRQSSKQDAPLEGPVFAGMRGLTSRVD
jgi:hypothetical protein